MNVTNFSRYAIAALVLPGLAGCSGSSPGTNTGAPIPGPSAPRSVSATLSNGLTGTLTEDRSTVPIGGTVNYTVTLTNSTTQPVTFQALYAGYVSPPVPAALFVKNSSGQLVDPLGPGDTIGLVAPPVTLAPGQSVSETKAVITDTQNALALTGYAAAGQYTAQASFDFSLNGDSSAADAVGPLTVTAQ